MLGTGDSVTQGKQRNKDTIGVMQDSNKWWNNDRWDLSDRQELAVQNREEPDLQKEKLVQMPRVGVTLISV